MKHKVFLDTNVFIYSIDSSPPLKEKTDIARQIVKEHIRGGTSRSFYASRFQRSRANAAQPGTPVQSPPFTLAPSVQTLIARVFPAQGMTRFMKSQSRFHFSSLFIGT